MAGLAISLLLAAAPPQPTPATFRAVGDSARPSLVLLRCDKRTSAVGLIAGEHGELLAPIGACGKRPVQLEVNGKLEPLVKLKQSEALGVQLVQLPAGNYSAAPVSKRTPENGAWIVAVGLSGKGTEPAAGMIRLPEGSDGFWLIDAPARAGAGVYTLEGKLLGIAVQPAPRHQMKVAPIAALRAWLTGASP
ncbi:MAG: hypothetical protein JST54_16030 [Deltaproteobacteria bacterium]|nr:hypothetical protein [Deltaproteobacteria bacterium]